MEERRVSRSEAGQKLLRYLRKVLPEAPDSFFYKMLRKKNIVLSGHGKCTGQEILEDGDLVRFFLSGETFRNFGGKPLGAERGRAAFEDREPGASDTESASEGGGPRGGDPGSGDPRKRDSGRLLPSGKAGLLPSGERIPRRSASPREKLLQAGVSVIFEDEDFLFVSKPAGLLVQGDRSGQQSLAGILAELSDPLSTTRWAPMHRLDRNTSGLVLCGKTLRGQQLLARVLGERSLEKSYLALVKGHLPGEGSFRAWHRKDVKTNTVLVSEKPLPGSSPIETVFRELGRQGGFSLVEANLVTGRSHQIRAHLAFLGCPILGDAKYGGLDPAFPKVRTQLLHAERVTFGRLGEAFSRLEGRSFAAPLPETMKGVLKQIGIRKPENGNKQ